jgi:hypothetical protein
MDYLELKGGFIHKNNMISFNLDMYLFREGESYIVYNPALDMSAYGDTEEDAKKSFESILESSIKYSLNKNTFKEDLLNHGWEIKSLKQKKIKSPSIEELLEKNECLRDIINNKEYTRYKKDVCISELA